MTKKYLLIILALSLLTRFAFFGHPAETVFDEVHFGKFVSGYFTGEYFFDIHPPLGKLLIAGMAKISGFEPGFSFKDIGLEYQDDSYKWLRFLPKLAGALLPAVIFLIALELGISQKFAFLAGLLIVFENALLAQSRLILIDSFLLLFGFLSVLFYLKHQTISYKRSPITNNSYLFLAADFASLAASVKWTGLTFLALILIFYFYPLVNQAWRGSAAEIRLRSHTIKGLVFFVVIPFLVYFSIFTIHFALLKNPGPGLAFHPPNFQEMSIFKKFVLLNSELYLSNRRLGASHPYSSQWFQWPFMNKPIFYWDGSTSLTTGASISLTTGGSAGASQAAQRIYLIGNPLIWWLSFLAVIYAIINFKKLKKSASYLLLITYYFLNWLPFIFIGRVMFLYHYFTSLIFAVLILALTLDISKLKRKNLIFNTILIGSIILFLFFSPLTYGLMIPEAYYKLLVWLPSWR